jgi:hypothetical protein
MKNNQSQSEMHLKKRIKEGFEYNSSGKRRSCSHEAYFKPGDVIQQ